MTREALADLYDAVCRSCSPVLCPTPAVSPQVTYRLPIHPQLRAPVLSHMPFLLPAHEDLLG